MCSGVGFVFIPQSYPQFQRWRQNAAWDPFFAIKRHLQHEVAEDDTKPSATSAPDRPSSVVTKPLRPHGVFKKRDVGPIPWNRET
jgi:hypothetical protein